MPVDVGDVVEIDRRAGLVGRDGEVALLRRAVDDTLAGHAQTIVIAGEPGIGKTALAEDASDYASHAGALPLWGSCWEGDGAPAFWPWVQIVRTYARDRRTDDLYALMGDGAADIARLVPEVAGRFLTLTPPGDTDPDQARFRLFDRIARFIRAAAEDRPLVLVFDDLHWADSSSLMLLRFFARSARSARGAGILVIGTYRDVELGRDHPARETLAEIAGVRLTLGGLERSDVAALIRETTGSEPAAGLAEAVFGRTTGNPFFVKEIARLLDAQGRIGSSAVAASYTIPDGVRDVVRRRLAHLRQETVALLGAASVLGPEFDVDLLGRTAELPAAEVLERLDSAADARIVVEDETVVGRYRFAHALVRDVLYEDLGASARASLHWRAGEVLEAQDRAGSRRAEIAHHLVKGAAAGDATKAAETAIRAARLSMGMYAWDQAAELYRRAVDALTQVGADGALRVRTMLELGDALTRGGDLAGARRTYEEAADLAGVLGMAAELAHAALGLGGGLGGFEVRLFDDRQLDLLDRALAALPTEDSPIRAWILARLSVASSFVRPAEERAALAEEAIAMARRLGDRGSLSYALSSLCDALAGPDHLAERIAASTEMIELASQPADGAARCGVESCTTCLCDPEFALLGRRFRIVAGLEQGDMASVDADIEAYARLADHLRQPLYRWYAPLFRGMRSLLRGNFAETERHLAEAEAIADRTSSGNARVLIQVQRGGLALERDDPSAAEAAFRSVYEATPELERFPSSAGMDVTFETLFGDVERARPMLREWIRQGGLKSLDRDAEWLSSAAYAAECATRLGDVVAAEHIYEALSPYADRFVVDGIGSRFMGSVAHYLGCLAAILGRTAEAASHLETATAAHRSVGAARWADRSRAELARVREGSGRAAPDIAAGVNLFRLEGEFWTIAFDGVVVRLKDSKGLRDIAELLRAPGREVAARDLVGAEAPGSVRPSGDAGELLDDRAREAYKRRIVELQAQIDDPDEDPTRVERAREELGALSEQLSRAYGLGGRARRAADPAERARKAVTERVRDAIARTGRENPALGRHLKASIRTGAFCSYTPEHPVTWSF